MIIAINYSNEVFAKARKINSISAKIFGRVDKVISYGPNDIDVEFRNKYFDILSLKRGNGYWLWKPYFIKVTLDRMNEGDYLVYSDSGMCYVRNIDDLIKKMNQTNQDVFLTDIPLLEVQFTHPNVINRLNAEIFNFTNQIQGAPIILKKSKFSCNFIDEWLTLCQDKSLLIVDESVSSTDEILFISHREDQSLLSICAKKNGIKPFVDVSDYGRFPIQYLSNDILFRKQTKEHQYTIRKTYFLLYRRSNVTLYFIKYIIKRLFSKMGLINSKLFSVWAEL
jgi:hypothetical protein